MFQIFSRSITLFMTVFNRCFLSLRRFDKFVLGRALKGIKITKCEWLYPTGVRVTSQGHIAARRKMASWLHFVYTQLVVSLARANFYVTENEASKLRYNSTTHCEGRFRLTCFQETYKSSKVSTLVDISFLLFREQILIFLTRAE